MFFHRINELKIVHLISSLSNAGIERLLVDICQTNDYKKNPLMVIIINHVVDDTLLSDLRKTSAEVIELKRRPGGQKLKYILLIRSILKYSKPHVLHMHDDLSVFFGVLGGLYLKTKKIFTLHAVNLFPRSLKGRITKFLAIKLVDRFIAISSSVKTDFVAGTCIDGENITVVPNGIRLEKFQHTNRRLRLEEIICVARLLHQKKGQDVLIKALSILKKEGLQCSCKIVGDGISRHYLANMALEYGLRDSMQFLGNRHDVPELLSKAGIFVLPSRYEGFGISIIEAMAAGIPVVASNIDGPKEIITDAENGLLFEVDNENELAEKINMLVNDFDLRNKIVKNAFSTIQYYTIEKMHNKYLEVYNSV